MEYRAPKFFGHFSFERVPSKNLLLLNLPPLNMLVTLFLVFFDKTDNNCAPKAAMFVLIHPAAVSLHNSDETKECLFF